MTSILSMRDVCFSYDGLRNVLDNVDIDIEKGQLYCILGCNGCGKSTLMNTMIGINRPLSGSVLIDGRDVADYDPAELAKKIAIVFQDAGAAFPFTVLEMVKMGRAPYVSRFGAPDGNDEAEAIRALDDLGIGHLKDKIYTQISGGERQMVLIARALAQQTDMILMDEPTSHLDYRNQVLVMETASHLANVAGKAIVVTTHSPQQAFQHGAKAILMHKGHIIASGDSREIIDEKKLSLIYNIDIRLNKSVDPRSGETFYALLPEKGQFDHIRYRDQSR